MHAASKLGTKLFVTGLLTLAPSLYASNILNIDSMDRIENRYIVVLKTPLGLMNSEQKENFVDSNIRRLLVGDQVIHRYSAALTGFSINTDSSEIEKLANDPEVAYIEADQLVTISAEKQEKATWGLDRIDARGGLDSTYHYKSTGKGVHAYIVDTGLRTTHNEFTGRVSDGFSAIEEDTSVEDCNGHGTHVAGTVGGTLYGVAKEVTIHPVRVLDCNGSGSFSGVIAGLDWIAKNAIKPAVANMSLGGTKTDAVDEAVATVIRSGVVFVVAAGNSNADACKYSPAATPEAITVGATSSNDSRSSFSNYGKCLDIFAPGNRITSAWMGGDDRTKTISGTSMASPHVAGVAALLLEESPEVTPEDIAKTMIEMATPDLVTKPGIGSPNLLVFTNPHNDDTNTPPKAP